MFKKLRTLNQEALVEETFINSTEYDFYGDKNVVLDDKYKRRLKSYKEFCTSSQQRIRSRKFMVGGTSISNKNFSTCFIDPMAPILSVAYVSVC
jgi:hypothetical protein